MTIERRLSLKLLAYWERRRSQRDMPEKNDIIADDLGDVWQDCFLLHLTDHEDPRFATVHRGENLHSDWPNMAHLTASISTLLEKRGPVIEDGQIYDIDGEIIKYRQCLLPLGTEGRIDAILGGARFKVLTGV